MYNNTKSMKWRMTMQIIPSKQKRRKTESSDVVVFVDERRRKNNYYDLSNQVDEGIILGL